MTPLPNSRTSVLLTRDQYMVLAIRHRVESKYAKNMSDWVYEIFGAEWSEKGLYANRLMLTFPDAESAVQFKLTHL